MNENCNCDTPVSPEERIAALTAANASVSGALRSAETLCWSDVADDASPFEVCSLLVGKLKDTVDMSGLGMFLLNDQTMEFDLAVSVPETAADLVQEEFNRQIDAGTVGVAVREQRIIALDPLTENPDFYNELGVILFPLATARSVRGLVLCFMPHNRENISQDVLRLLNILSSHLGLLLENAQLRAQLRVLRDKA